MGPENFGGGLGQRKNPNWLENGNPKLELEGEKGERRPWAGIPG